MMATTKPGSGADDAEPFDPSEQSPTEISKPIGDAIPTPVEPGLDQPLPEKGEQPAKHDRADSAERADPAAPADADEPLGESDPPKGVPAPGPSDFALRETVGSARAAVLPDL
jgi:hypothetical protein